MLDKIVKGVLILSTAISAAVGIKQLRNKGGQ